MSLTTVAGDWTRAAMMRCAGRMSKFGGRGHVGPEFSGRRYQDGLISVETDRRPEQKSSGCRGGQNIKGDEEMKQ
ncbi:conserved hypothetical protein [Coccidioides posadasii str. Silveira]|uniref:Uncharacterized protein n=1 Tax=Coccidioides posadasii (strain RMSCC 757 / Silveira) TaxID=443226 RepID=E9D895_COCPS|nr:conserved hypothetical protein [Coccidioides posadasii str. Silveira]